MHYDLKKGLKSDGKRIQQNCPKNIHKKTKTVAFYKRHGFLLVVRMSVTITEIHIYTDTTCYQY